MFGLGKLFGSDKVIDKAIDGIYNGVDSLVFTDQEKAERHLKLLKLYEPFKLAQRYLMMIVSLPFVSIHILAAVLFSYGFINESVHLTKGAKELAAFNNDGLLYPFIAIVTMYTGGGAIEGYVKARTSR